MRIIDENGNIRIETRNEILARHDRMRKEHTEKMDFLESIKAELVADGKSEDHAVAAEREWTESRVEAGLTSEINTSTDLVSVRDTLENISELLTKYRNGFKGFIKGSRGEIKPDPYTTEETSEVEAYFKSLS